MSSKHQYFLKPSLLGLQHPPVDSAAVDETRELPESRPEGVPDTAEHKDEMEVLLDALLEHLVHRGRGGVHLEGCEVMVR